MVVDVTRGLRSILGLVAGQGGFHHNGLLPSLHHCYYGGWLHAQVLAGCLAQQPKYRNDGARPSWR
jgi:hypothetical protein